MSTPQPSANDHELSALAAARGFTLARVKFSESHLYFLKNALGELLFDGRSFDRRELAGAILGGPKGED
ncbi:MAG: hypothetical protein ACYDBT_09960 [Desulfobulbaceae bacterium]